ncbi:MAG: response regulator [Bryobacteraceae bacterium]
MSGARGAKRVVVLVEDAQECSTALEVALSLSGRFAVRTFGSAEDALQVMQSEPPDALVTDIHLPGMSGLALIREMRASGMKRQPRIIAVSGGAGRQLEAEALSAGADAFFAKPYSPKEVCSVLEGMIDED